MYLFFVNACNWIWLRLILLFQPRPPAPAPSPDPVPPHPYPSVVIDLLNAHNALRKANSVPPLQLNFNLTRAAQKQAGWQALSRHATHTDQEGHGVGYRIRREDYLWVEAGENVASGQRDVETVMQTWGNSLPHFKNILRAWIDAGFGVATDLKGKKYWVAVFALPAHKESRMLEKVEYLPAPLPTL